MNHNLLDDLSYLDKEKPKFVYVGFVERLGAMALDVFITYVVLFVIFRVLQLLDPFVSSGFGRGMEEFIIGMIFLAYLPVMESSRLQGSFGKYFLGVKVIDKEGNRISLGRAAVRFVLKFLSFFAFFLGFIMIALTKDKQGLHDVFAETYVVEK